MKWVTAFAVILAISACAAAQSGTTPTKNWRSTLGEDCRRCVSTKFLQMPVPLPRRAIIYGFTGEFARKADTWLADLDTGEIVNWEDVSNDAGESKRTISHRGTVDSGALERLRASAATLWRSERGDIMVSPGTVEEDYVISGARMVAFSRFAPSDHDVVTAINSALPAEAANTNGSFVVLPNRN